MARVDPFNGSWTQACLFRSWHEETAIKVSSTRAWRFRTSESGIYILGTTRSIANVMGSFFHDWRRTHTRGELWIDFSGLVNSGIVLLFSIRAKVSQYHNDLKNLKKNALLMNEILLKILHTVDLLGLVGEKLKVEEHIEAIFWCFR